jgi:hypothetical protein
MVRQISLVLIIIIIILIFGQVLIFLKPKKAVTVQFKDGMTPPKLTGQVTKKERYIVIEPEDGSEEQVFTWDQIKSITGTEPAYNKKIDEVTDLIELVAKLGVLAAAGVFLIGLYQFDVGQRWKKEEFLSEAVNDFGRRDSVENAKKMLELLMFYPQGRKIQLYPENESSTKSLVTVAQIGKALSPRSTDELSDDEMKIRECFDAFLSRLERFEHYIESGLVSESSLSIYLGYWINTLLGRETTIGKKPRLNAEHRQWILRYAEAYEFPLLEKLLGRYRESRSRFGWLKRQLRRPKRQSVDIPPTSSPPAADDSSKRTDR